MTPELYAKASALVGRMVELKTSEWSSVLADAEADDPGIGAIARTLLDAYLQSTDFLEGDIVSVCLGTLLGDSYTEDADPFELIGTVIDDRYAIKRLIARGGMGAVYLARHTKLPRDIAIKVVPRHLGDRLAIEGSAACTIRHPAVVAVTDFNKLPNGDLYLAMDYVDSGSLRAMLDRAGKLDLSRAVEIVRQVASALDAAHEERFVHRDIKPENILVDVRDAKLKVSVIDFGIAKRRDDRLESVLTEEGALLGTPPYMSPEQLGYVSSDGSNEIDGRSDTYSLAVVFFEMVAGSRPIEGRNVWDLREKIVGGAHRRLSELAPAIDNRLSNVVARALSVDRADRPSSAGEFANSLRSNLEGEDPFGYRSIREDVKPARLFDDLPGPLFELDFPSQSTPPPVQQVPGTMALLERLELETPRGRAVVEFLHGDLMAMPRDWGVDILVVSAAPRDYEPLPGSLIEALSHRGIDIGELSRSKIKRYGPSWLSERLVANQSTIPIKFVLCFEPMWDRSPSPTVTDLFDALVRIANQQVDPVTIAMPIVSAGWRGAPVFKMGGAILSEALKALRDGANIARIIVVERDRQRADELQETIRNLR